MSICFLVQVDLKGQDVKVTGGRLPGTYIVEQFHFHWGPESHTGSEHTLDGKQFSSEVSCQIIWFYMILNFDCRPELDIYYRQKNINLQIV